jgi:menaquinone-specific isochorismate synthase
VTKLRSKTVRVPSGAALLDAAPSVDGAIVWTRGGDGMVAFGEAARFDPGAGAERFVRAAHELESIFRSAEIEDDVRRPGTGPVAFLSFTFDPDTHGSRIVIPSFVMGRAGDDAWATITAPAGAQPVPHEAQTDTSTWTTSGEQAFTRAVARARGEIRAGWLAKVVLARCDVVDANQPFDVARIVRALAGAYPECFTFSFDGLVGSSPEMLVRRMQSTIESLVLAGSYPRGATQHDDERLGAELAASAKQRSEHAFAAASAKDVLELICSDLKVDAEPWLLKLANVQHLATSLKGELIESPTALEIAGKLHPTAAVCGVPSTDALQIIRSYEGFDRGRYAGPIGWVDHNGDGEIAIALRCAEIHRSKARLFAGNGIVADSEPDDELAETKLKLKAMQNAMGLTT